MAQTMIFAPLATQTTALLSPKYEGSNKATTVFDTSAAQEGNPHQRGVLEVESVISRSLHQENDLLRCQLNEFIVREKSQRVELQQLRQDRDADVQSMVEARTSHFRSEVDQLNSMLQTTSAQLLRALGEREQFRGEIEQLKQDLKETKRIAASQESRLNERLTDFGDALNKGASLARTLADAVEMFQRHVLPTFRPSTLELNKMPLRVPPEVPKGKMLMQELTRLENSLSLLRVLIDAKNDTLVLIRGKLKHENEELRIELQMARDSKINEQTPALTPSDFDSREKDALKQELQSLQFLIRQPKSGRISAEKMDLMKTMNQLLNEMNMLKGEKIALEEELKAQRRSEVHERVRRTVTARDIEMAASNRVGDSEVASKLVRARMEQLGVQERSTPRILSPNPTDSYSSSGMSSSPLNMASTNKLKGGLQRATCSLEIPAREDPASHSGFWVSDQSAKAA